MKRLISIAILGAALVAGASSVSADSGPVVLNSAQMDAVSAGSYYYYYYPQSYATAHATAAAYGGYINSAHTASSTVTAPGLALSASASSSYSAGYLHY